LIVPFFIYDLNAGHFVVIEVESIFFYVPYPKLIRVITMESY